MSGDLTVEDVQGGFYPGITGGLTAEEHIRYIRGEKAFCNWCGNYHQITGHEACRANVAAGLLPDGQAVADDEREMYRTASLAAQADEPR